MEKVYVVRCADYSQVGQKMTELIDAMGGMDLYASKGEKIVLKPNLLAAAEPGRAVTTHPSILTAVGLLAKQAGADVLIADSPGSGYPYTEKTLRRTYHTSGMDTAAEEAAVALNFDTSYEAVSYPQGERFKRFEIITPVVQADGVFNLCKLKTHGFMHMTCAIKNLFGVIAGLTKPGYHAKLREKSHFANMLLDLASCVSPRLHILDAVVGMEGNGPHNGELLPVGLLLGSTSALAMDVVAGAIMGLPMENNPVLSEAQRRGMSPVRLDQVELKGMDAAELHIPGFKLPSTVPNLFDRVFSLLFPVFKDGFSVKPRVLDKKCLSCGSCRDACPMHVITIAGKESPARIQDKGCIRCYCCHEMCPHDAIELHSGFLYRMLNRR